MKLKILISGLYLLLTCQSVVAQTDQTVPEGSGPWIVLAHYQDKEDVLALKPFYDLWKIDEKNQTVLLMVKHQADYAELLTRGFTVKPHDGLMQQQHELMEKQWQGVRTIDNFPCYRTVDETFAAMSSMQANYPSLVTLVDIGDSWHKTNAGGDPGHDMQVVKITNSSVVDPDKPILYAMGSIHSREYPPAELVTRFAEYLLSEYGNNADVTWLVDHHEIHLLLLGNPDGRDISEVQPSPNQRKNRNENHCFNGSQQGVDMNRNFDFLWNQGSGSSGVECSEVYRGVSAVSEPETTAIHNYIQTLFPDDRPDDLVTAAPLTKPGVYLDIHNVAELTLFPWGYSNVAPQAPNHAQLQTLARRMSFHTGYRPEQSNASLGGADGASDDNAYGTLGVAAYTIELGEGSFYSSCSAFDNTIWPDNLDALIYAAKASRMPYTIASGPEVIDLPLAPIEVSMGQTFDVSGTATDLRFNNNNGTEATQNITSVTAYLDTPSWNGGVGVNMTATDGSFNSKSESFNGELDAVGLAEGRYTVWFEASDAGGITGVASAVFVDVLDPANVGIVAGVIKDQETNAVIDEVTVEYDSKQTQSNALGEYSIETTATTSDLMFSKVGYFNQTVADVVTTGGLITTENVFLEPTCEVQVMNEDVEGFSDISQAITAGWSLQTGTGANDWRVESGEDHTVGGGRSFVSTDVASTTDKSLVTPELILPQNAELIFWHKHQFEAGNDNYDGGVIEISTNGGSSWTDLGNLITQNGYNGTLNGGFGQPLGAVPAFVDTLGTFSEVKVDLSSYDNSSVKIRWRMGTDNSQAAGDWKVDDIRIFAAGVCEGPDDVIFEHGFEQPL